MSDDNAQPLDPLDPEVERTETVESAGDPGQSVSEGEREPAPSPQAGDAQDGDAQGGDASESGSEPEGDELTLARMALEERTLDLQRLQAEYLNYKRRVDRDRELLKENATYAALSPIVDVLDTIDRAREHGPLDDGFKAVAEQLEHTVAGLGLLKFGAPGDAFDPNVHEALSHIGTDPDVTVTTCKVIAKAGYKIGERVVRAAQVLVVDPVEG